MFLPATTAMPDRAAISVPLTHTPVLSRAWRARRADSATSCADPRRRQHGVHRVHELGSLLGDVHLGLSWRRLNSPLAGCLGFLPRHAGRYLGCRCRVRGAEGLPPVTLGVSGCWGAGRRSAARGTRRLVSARSRWCRLRVGFAPAADTRDVRRTNSMNVAAVQQRPKG
jgi:hypothetical protein